MMAKISNEGKFETTTIRVSKKAAKACKLISMYEEGATQQDIVEKAIDKFIKEWQKKNPTVKFPANVDL